MNYIQLIVGAVILAAIGGAIWYINDHAYNRGVAATVSKMQVLIQKGSAVVGKDMDEVTKLPPDKLDERLTILCLKHGGTKETCHAQ